MVPPKSAARFRPYQQAFHLSLPGQTALNEGCDQEMSYSQQNLSREGAVFSMTSLAE
jgi:hypothetical protein